MQCGIPAQPRWDALHRAEAILGELTESIGLISLRAVRLPTELFGAESGLKKKKKNSFRRGTGRKPCGQVQRASKRGVLFFFFFFFSVAFRETPRVQETQETRATRAGAYHHIRPSGVFTARLKCCSKTRLEPQPTAVPARQHAYPPSQAGATCGSLLPFLRRHPRLDLRLALVCNLSRRRSAAARAGLGLHPRFLAGS